MRSRSIGRRYGVRLDQYVGAWCSFGVHIHLWPLSESHIDLHLFWWLVTIGRHYGGKQAAQR